MKIAIEKLEHSFEEALDLYCFHTEAGNIEKAEEECYRAGECMEALEMLKKMKTSQIRNEIFLKAVMAYSRDNIAAE